MSSTVILLSSFHGYSYQKTITATEIQVKHLKNFGVCAWGKKWVKLEKNKKWKIKLVKRVCRKFWQFVTSSVQGPSFLSCKITHYSFVFYLAWTILGHKHSLCDENSYEILKTKQNKKISMKTYGTTRAQVGKCWENQHHNLQHSLPLPTKQPSVFGYKLLRPQIS